MKIQSLSLENFRNYEQKKIKFSEGVNVILGENGIGKTNILEAIFTLSFSKPFRSQKREVFLKHHSEYGKISGEFSGEGGEKLEIFWGVNPKKVSVYKKNDIKISTSEYIHQKKFLSILFSPEEMNLPISAPEQRRKYLSRVLSPLFPEYFEASLKYNSLLKNRNALLKKYAEPYSGVEKSEFFFWDLELSKYHAILQKFRIQFFERVNQKISQYYSDIAKTPETVEIQFIPSLSPEQNFLDILEKNFEIDVRRGRTTEGSHRDDFAFLLRGIPLEEGASRGETRTTILALKKCEQDFVQEFGKSSPILLLDDVFSELDIVHQEHLLKSISGYQSIITTTELHVSFQDIKDIKIHQL